MKHLSFILWLIFYPLATKFGSYIATKEKILRDGKAWSDNNYHWASLIDLIIWIWVAKLIY